MEVMTVTAVSPKMIFSLLMAVAFDCSHVLGKYWTMLLWKSHQRYLYLLKEKLFKIVIFFAHNFEIFHESIMPHTTDKHPCRRKNQLLHLISSGYHTFVHHCTLENSDFWFHGTLKSHGLGTPFLSYDGKKKSSNNHTYFLSLITGKRRVSHNKRVLNHGNIKNTDSEYIFSVKTIN